MTAWVIKIGGSLMGCTELPRWLDVIATTGAGKVVLVPGGGPWAEEVRQAQQLEGFDERVAHRKALRAMEQFGKVLAGMRANLVPASSVAQFHAVLRDRGVAVWMPCEMVVADNSIPESWDVTSDSLAAWLARRLDASVLLLVKSVKVKMRQPGIEELMRLGWVDRAFAQFATGAHFRLVLAGRQDYNAAQRMLTAEQEVTAEKRQSGR